MPRKVRLLMSDLKQAGFVELPRRGKGSHSWWVHPELDGVEVNRSGNDGDDAQRYQERVVREALAKVSAADN